MDRFLGYKRSAYTQVNNAILIVVITLHTWVTLGDPRQSVERRLTIVETDVLLLLASGVAPLVPLFSPAEAAALASLSNNSLLRPCSAKGAGSTPRRVNLSARDAKHLKAPSETFRKQEIK